MSTHPPSNQATVRTLVVIALATIVVAYTLPDISRAWQPTGNFGIAADADNVITLVQAGSNAERAGLKVGDRIDMAASSPESRVVAANGGTVRSPNQQVTFAVLHGNEERYVTLSSEAFEVQTSTKALIVARVLAMLVFVGIGAALVLLRPSIATWGFYVYCLGLNGAPSVVAPTLFGSPWNWIIILVSYSIGGAAWVGVAVFAVFFLHETKTGWRGIVYRLAPVALLAAIGLEIYTVIAPNWLGWRANSANYSLLLLQGALALVAIGALVGTYVSAGGKDRQRIRWVVFGFGVAMVAAVIALFPDKYPYWVYATLQLTGVVVPLTVAYAVIRHRVIDVSFVINRTLVYGILTTLLVGAFALVDWLFIDRLKLARLGAIAEIGVAVAGGFWFKDLHKRVDAFIDATFFRQRHKAEVQLARDAAALPFSTTAGAVAHALVAEPVRALSLASAALFRKGPDGGYLRETSEGWGEADIAKFGPEDDYLLTLLHAENGPVSLYDHPWRTQGVPLGPAQPVLVVPIVVRRELSAIVFYGSHTHGESLDPDEIKAIAGLAPGAAAAYDHLDAEAMRREVDALKRKNESLETQLAEAQIQPA